MKGREQRRESVTDFGRSPTEREVLRVMWSDPRDHLVRSEIHRRMPRELRPTLGRVGQILTSLDRAGLLDKVQRRSQGNRSAAFYTLSERGRGLCKSLGFDHEEKALFPVTQEQLDTYLTPSYLASHPEAPCHIAALYAYRGGIGRTTMAANTARRLAEGSGLRILLVDLDLDTAGLDRYFAPQGLGTCKGLRGLIIHCFRQLPRSRPDWLRHALKDTKFVLQPFPDEAPTLFYLPGALAFSQGDSHITSQRAEALSHLYEEAGFSRLSGRSERGAESDPFTSMLRGALRREFDMVVINAEPGSGLGAWIATKRLADHLVLCLQPSDHSPNSLDSLRSVIVNFLDSDDTDEDTGGLLFSFFVERPQDTKRLARWIDEYIVGKPDEQGGKTSTPEYTVEQVVYSERIKKDPFNWSYNTIQYSKIAACLLSRELQGSGAKSPELTALIDVLNPNLSTQRRSLAAGVLSNSHIQDFKTSAAWYIQDSALHEEPDDHGKAFLRGAIESQVLKTRRELEALLKEIMDPPEL